MRRLELREDVNCLLVALTQVGSDMSVRILVPLAGVGGRLCEKRLENCAAAAGTCTPLCYTSRHTNRPPSNIAAVGPIS